MERAIRNRSADEILGILLDGGLRDIAGGHTGFRAVRHPLGFICLPLSRGERAVGVCVHIWSAGDVATRATSAVHCHSWDLLSFVLAGAVENQTYQVADDADGPLRVYEIRSVDGQDEIAATERRVHVSPGPSGVHPGGEFYELPAGHFHASRIRSSEAVTVVVGRLVDEAGDLSLGDPDVVPAARRRDRFDAETTVAIVGDLLARLSVGALTP
ncbi:hypothetical protein [Catellatospora sp. NPDC049609]|uniref:hypothetical protein n=1 Tax=Catellatospora sp. NPDC049609 TaxID=3155505 RepID=UPI00343BC972